MFNRLRNDYYPFYRRGSVMSEIAKERCVGVFIYSSLTIGAAFSVYAGENSMQYVLGLIFGS